MKVPHIKQKSETSCGAAALAMVYGYLGKPEETESKIFERLKTKRPNVEGEFYIRNIDLAKDSLKHNLSYFIGTVPLSSKKTAFQALKKFLSLSIPVVACQRVTESSTFGHCRVVVGIDQNNNITVHDPLDDDSKIIAPEVFMKLWQRTNEDEVVGGQFFAIFRKEDVGKENSFLVNDFNASVSSFKATSLEFN